MGLQDLDIIAGLYNVRIPHLEDSFLSYMKIIYEGYHACILQN